MTVSKMSRKTRITVFAVAAVLLAAVGLGIFFIVRAVKQPPEPTVVETDQFPPSPDTVEYQKRNAVCTLSAEDAQIIHRALSDLLPQGTYTAYRTDRWGDWEIENLRTNYGAFLFRYETIQKYVGTFPESMSELTSWGGTEFDCFVFVPSQDQMFILLNDKWPGSIRCVGPSFPQEAKDAFRDTMRDVLSGYGIEVFDGCVTS